MKLHALCAAACALALSLTGTAHAVIVDVSATTGVSTSITLDAGTYNISWIDNTANGGYAGWSAAMAGSTPVRWREAVSFSADGVTYTVDKWNSSGTYYRDYADAATALAAFQTAPYALFVGSTPTPYWWSNAQINLTAPNTLTFSIPDHRLVDNTGGVSLSVTAIPEPSTYALLIGGLGVVGFMARRRRA